MKAAICAKITYQLKCFFEEAGNYCKASKVLSKCGFLANTRFYITYYDAIAHYFKGREFKDNAEENGGGMGNAEGHLVLAMNKLSAAVTYDARTKDALKQRKEMIENEYEDVKTINKNVYYEGCTPERELAKIESKNFTLHRSILPKLEEAFAGAENFEVFLPMEVRKLEGEFQQEANKIINQNMEILQKLSADEDGFLGAHGLPQSIYSMSSKEEIPEDLWNRVSEFQQRGNYQYLENLLAGVKQNRQTCFDIVGKCEAAVVGEENDDSTMRATHGARWQRLPSSSLNGEIKTRIESYKANLDKAFSTDSTVETNVGAIKPKMALLQLSRNELTQKMPKSQASDAASSPAVANIQQAIEQLNELKRQRQTLVNNMTGGLESADLRKDLMAVHQGTLGKESAFENHLQALNQHATSIEDQQVKSSELLSNIDTNMMAFNQLLAGSSETDKMDFFKSIDEGLKVYYENMNLLSNGAKFYKQMHTYLTSLHLYINDFVASRTVEKDQIIEQLNGGGGPPPGAPGATGTPYNPSFIPQNPYGGGQYQ